MIIFQMSWLNTGCTKATQKKKHAWPVGPSFSVLWHWESVRTSKWQRTPRRCSMRILHFDRRSTMLAQNRVAERWTGDVRARECGWGRQSLYTLQLGEWVTTAVISEPEHHFISSLTFRICRWEVVLTPSIFYKKTEDGTESFRWAEQCVP